MRVKRERIEIPVAEGRMVTRNGRKVGVVRLAGFSSGRARLRAPSRWTGS